MSKKIEKDLEKKDLEKRGYIVHLKKDYPKTEGQMICLFQTSRDAPYAQTKISKQYWEYYKKTTDIKDRCFYWKKIN